MPNVPARIAKSIVAYIVLFLIDFCLVYKFWELVKFDNFAVLDIVTVNDKPDDGSGRLPAASSGGSGIDMKHLKILVVHNFEDMRILTKDGKVEELDAEKLASSNKEASDYKKNISEILIYIKQNSNNTEKQESLLEFLDDNKNNKYKVSINYDDNGLVRVVRAKIQEN